MHGRALIRRARDPDMPARLPDEPIDHRQPEPASLADVLRREERLKHALQHLSRHAGARVFHLDDGILARRNALFAPVRSEGRIARDDRDRSPVRHCIACIDDEVEHAVLELPRIRTRRPEVGLELSLDFDVARERAPQQLVHAVDHPVQVDDLGLEHLLTCEPEQAPRQRRTAHCRAQGRLGLAQKARAFAQRAREQLHVADDDGQQIVEIVRDAAREAADRFHLLALPQLRFELTFVRHVPRGDDAALQLAVLVVVRQEQCVEIEHAS